MCACIVDDLRVLRNLLDVVSGKWYQIGIQLGIPKHKLDEFNEKKEPIIEVLNYWLNKNVKGGDPVSWETIVKALRSRHVDEPGLATIIQEKYCEGTVLSYYNRVTRSTDPTN